MKDMSKVQRDGRYQQEKQQDHARLLQLEGPADGRPARAQAKQQPAQRQACQHDPGGVGQRFALGGALIAACAGKAHRLQADDGKDAGHDVEQQPAKDCPCQRGEDGGESAIVLKCRHDARHSADLKATPAACRQHAGQPVSRTALCLCLYNQLIAQPFCLLGRGIGNRVFGFGKEPGVSC